MIIRRTLGALAAAGFVVGCAGSSGSAPPTTPSITTSPPPSITSVEDPDPPSSQTTTVAPATTSETASSTLPAAGAGPHADRAWETGLPVVSLVGVSSDEVWVVAAEGRERVKGLYRIDATGELEHIDGRAGGVVVDSDGTSWKSTVNGLSRFTGDSWSEPEPPPLATIRDGRVWSMTEDPDPECRIENWSTPNRLERRFDSTTTVWSCRDLPRLFVDGIYPGPDGELAYLVGRGVDWEASPHSGFGELEFHVVDDGGATALPSPGGSTEPSGWLNATWAGPTGDLWLQLEEDRTRRTVLRRYDGTGWETIDPPGEADGPHGFAMGLDGRLWDATPSGLWVHDGTGWSPFIADEATAAVSVAPDGTLWVGIGTAVHRIPAASTG